MTALPIAVGSRSSTLGPVHWPKRHLYAELDALGCAFEVHHHAIKAWKHVSPVDVHPYRAALRALAGNAPNLHVKQFASKGSHGKLRKFHGVETAILSIRASHDLRLIFTRTRHRTIMLLDFVHRSNKFYYSMER